MGVGLGLSTLPFFGHDLGGFFGEIPSEEFAHPKLLKQGVPTKVRHPFLA